MIKSNIKITFPHHLNHYLCTDKNIYVADYTEQTKFEKTGRNVEIFKEYPPSDIGYFSLLNENKIQARAIIFNNKSFTYPNGNPRSQCECVIFPENSNINSWILFLELKYSNKTKNNKYNLQNAIIQLYKTRTYYYRSNIFQKSNTCYLLAALPEQREPFLNFFVPPQKLTEIKKKHNVVLRLQNSVSIDNNNSVIV